MRNFIQQTFGKYGIIAIMTIEAPNVCYVSREAAIGDLASALADLAQAGYIWSTDFLENEIRYTFLAR